MVQVVDLGGGRRASYEVIGKGWPTLMIPGGPGFDARHMRPHAGLFADQLECYLIDPHGCGESTPPQDWSEYAPAGRAAFYEEVRQALHLDRVVVLGASFGGATALTYSALFPDSTVACVAANPFGVGREADAGRDAAVDEEYEQFLSRYAGFDWYPEARKALDTWHDRVLATDDPAEIARMAATLFPLYVAHPERPDVAAERAAMDDYWTGADLACLKAWESGMYASFDLRPFLGKIACPTLVVAGELDFMCGPAQAVPIAAAIPGAHLALIPDCAHFPTIDAPAAYREAVISFLSELKIV